MPGGALDEAYVRLHSTGPEFGGDEEGINGLTNHGPMAVEVLDRRGYGDTLTAWLDGYVPRLVELPSGRAPITEDTWRDALGDGHRVGDWVAFFGREIGERPWTDVLRQWWPELLPGIVAGSTHGVIRTGHAVRTLSDGDTSDAALAELAHALAFWAARSRAIPNAAPPAGRQAPADALAGVPHLPEQSGLIAHRLARLADLPGWSDAQRNLRAPESPDEVPGVLDDLVEAATLRYLSYGHGSPVLLVHTATAPNAVRHCLPSLPSELWSASLAAVWSAAAALVAAYEPRYGVPRDELPQAPRADDAVAEVIDRAARHGDEHVIKFTDTAVEVFQRSGNPDALAAAVRITGLIQARG